LKEQKYRDRWEKLYRRQQKSLSAKSKRQTWAELKRKIIAANRSAKKSLTRKQMAKRLAAEKSFFRRMPERWIRSKRPGVWIDRFTSKEATSMQLKRSFSAALRERLTRAYAKRKRITLAKARKEIAKRLNRRVKGKRGKARQRALNRAFTMIIRTYGSRD
jgi:transcriptional regulator of acetoin/glycerol metabolism